MASSSTQNVDELIMCLVNMGFELDDAQQALKSGRLSVEEAIEWILAGKPSQTPSTNASATLRLHQPSQSSSSTVGSNPFNPATAMPAAQPPTQPPTQQEAGAAATTPPILPQVDQPAGLDSVISRTHMNDEQRDIKQKFEEKQRDIARKSAHKNKLTQKKAHAQILQQIAEDRERQRIRRGNGAKPEKVDTPPKKEEPQATPPTVKAPLNTVLQIRPPEGRPFTHNFSLIATLQDVWVVINEHCTNATDMCLIQPFPRVQYTEADMSKSLEELKLTPSGSLVLQRNRNPQGTAQGTAQVSAPTAMSCDDSSKATTDNTAAPAPGHQAPSGAMQGLSPHVQPLGASGSGGAGFNAPGHRLGAQTESNAAAVPPADPVEDAELEPVVPNAPELMEMVAPGQQNPPDVVAAHGHPDMEDDSDDSDDDMPGGAVGGGLGGAVGGGLGGAFGGGPAVGAGGPGQPWMGPQQGQHLWGDGEMLVGAQLNPQMLPHHTKTPAELAAMAANRRYAVHEDSPPLDLPSQPLLLSNVRTLNALMARHVTSRICATHQPITALPRIPTEIALQLIDCLKSEKRLLPKTLNAFLNCQLRRLNLDYYPLTTNELLLAIRLHKSLTYLSVRSCSLITDAGLQCLIALRKLTVLNIGDCPQITDRCTTIINQFASLESLILENTSITDAGMTNLCDGQLQHLQTLNLNHTRVTSHIWHCLPALPELSTLCLEHTQVASLAGINHLPNLRSLSLFAAPIVTESLMCLINCPALCALNISNTPNVHGDQALQYITGMSLLSLQLPSRLSTTDAGIGFISGMRLSTLDLTNYIDITDVGAAHIAKIKTLQRLRISNTKITDVGMNALAGLTSLVELFADKIPITDNIAPLFKHLVNLQELSLAETSLTDTLLASYALNSCQFLSKLNLSRTKVSSLGCVLLRLPILSLLNVDGTHCQPTLQDDLSNWCPQLKHVSCKNTTPLPVDDLL